MMPDLLIGVNIFFRVPSFAAHATLDHADVDTA